MLKDIFKFLGVNEEFMPDISVKHNVSSISEDKAPSDLLLKLQLRRQLVKVYQEDICKLQQLLQRDLSKWLE